MAQAIGTRPQTNIEERIERLSNASLSSMVRQSRQNLPED